MANLEVFHTDEHYVVTINIEKIAREIIGKGNYSSSAEVSNITRVVEEVNKLTFKKKTVNEAVEQAIGHLDLMREVSSE